MVAADAFFFEYEGPRDIARANFIRLTQWHRMHRITRSPTSNAVRVVCMNESKIPSLLSQTMHLSCMHARFFFSVTRKKICTLDHALPSQLAAFIMNEAGITHKGLSSNPDFGTLKKTWSVCLAFSVDPALDSLERERRHCETAQKWASGPHKIVFHASQSLLVVAKVPGIRNQESIRSRSVKTLKASRANSCICRDEDGITSARF
jgi:hypothetical protein